MSRYWIKIDDAVEGPYEAHLLKFVEGFTADTLVSPDQLDEAEEWNKARDIQELKSALGIIEPVPEVPPEGPPVPPPEVPDVVKSRKSGKPPAGDFESTQQLAAQPPETAQVAPETKTPQPAAIPEPDNVPKPEIEPQPVAKEEEKTADIPAVPTEKPADSIEEIPTASIEGDILDVMEKISEELSKKENREKKPEIPKAPIPEKDILPKPQEKKEEKKIRAGISWDRTSRLPKKSILWAASCAAVVILIIIFWRGGYFTVAQGKFQRWIKTAQEKLSSKPAAKAPAETAVEKDQKTNLQPPKVTKQSTAEKIEKKKEEKAAAPKPKIKSSSKPPAAPQATVRPPAEPAAPPKPVRKKLKNVKYLLPGVPAPNVKDVDIEDAIEQKQ